MTEHKHVINPTEAGSHGFELWNYDKDLPHLEHENIERSAIPKRYLVGSGANGNHIGHCDCLKDPIMRFARCPATGLSKKIGEPAFFIIDRVSWKYCIIYTDELWHIAQNGDMSHCKWNDITSLEDWNK